MKQIVQILEIILVAIYGTVLLIFPVTVLTSAVPYFYQIAVFIVISAIITATIGYLRKPFSPLSFTWVFAFSLTVYAAVACAPSPHPHLHPLALVGMVAVGCIGKNYGWIISFLLFTLGDTTRTIAVSLLHHMQLTPENLVNDTLLDPFRYFYLLLAGLLPSLLSASYRLERYTMRKAPLPGQPPQNSTSAMSAAPPENLKTQSFTLEHLSDYNQGADDEDISGLLASVVFFMSRNFRSFSSLGFIYDPKQQVFTLNSSNSKSIHIIKNVTIPLGKGVVGTIGSEKRSFMSGDLRVYNSELLYYSAEEQINSILAVPIISEQKELLGTLVLDSKDRQAFKDQDKDTLKRFSSLAAALITTARMRSFQERSAKTFQTFYQASHQFTTALNAEEVFIILFDVIPTIVPCSRQIGIVFDEGKGVGKVLGISGNSSDITSGFSFPINSGMYSFAFQKRKPVVIGDYQQYVDRYYRFVPNEVNNPSIRSLIIFPILDDEQRCRGLFSIESHEPNIFFVDTVQILTTLIENASVAFIRAILYNRMEQLATTDGLTGLNNHRHFQELLSREIERSSRYKRPLALLLMDIDHFKTFNDTYGHPVGDLVLKEIAQCIRKSIRQNDIPARYGGEEFVVIIPETNEQGAHISAERIRSTIEEHTIVSLNRELKVTVSIGCSAFPENAPSQQELIDTADKALYAAKEGGRNRVRLYTSDMK